MVENRRKCWFRKDEYCPIPEDILTAAHCEACARWKSIEIGERTLKASEELVKIQREMAKANVFQPDKVEGKKTDEKRDVT